MQIGWMEDDFRNLTANVWGNLDNPIKRLWVLKGFINLVYVALSVGTFLISVMSQQYNCRMELYTNIYQILLFIKIYLPSSVILWYVRAEIMCMHLWINLIKTIIGIQETFIIVKKNIYICTKSIESSPPVISHILAEFHPERATYTTLHNHFS